MAKTKVIITDKLSIGDSSELPLICGPCVLESVEKALFIAEYIKKNFSNYPVIFKSSFDKANRSSKDSFRGPGLVEGLKILQIVKERTGLPLLVDFHEPSQASAVAEVADILQIPAFLCRQTDMILAAAETGKTVNIKKGQFISPWDANKLVEKALQKTEKVLITERGYSFGYNNLVVDMRSIEVLKSLPCPVIYDATHSVQLPGGGTQTGGMRDMIVPLSRAALAVGIDAIFMEVYDEPARSPSDKTTIFPLFELKKVYERLLPIHTQSRNWQLKDRESGK
ncbi:3-deoxy-8-phosphooctulonate synthase [Candidatus Riflebacteria bacterium]